MSRRRWATPWAAPPEVPERHAAGEVLVAARAVVVDLGGQRVLHGVDLAAHAGGVVALVGPNGAGKSTLLHALTGDLPLASGVVEVGGRDVGSWSPLELALRRAVLPQQTVVTFPFTVEQVVRMGRSPWLGTTAEADDEGRIAAAVAAADVGHLLDRPVPRLSGGERARVALARVLAQDVQLVLLDEPTAALDVQHQESTLQVVRERTRAGCGAVVVLHDLGQAAAYADRVVILAEGAVVADGPPASVLQGDLLSEVYRHPIEVVAHPVTGAPLVLPRR